ncbi:hypothetical protein TREMEDRAFT_58766 [Tremella mesenterica DSM 1558]|uniref:uncharacterized protein n=1 Tax=Tremella mesenterica (strain ATCC 24925 / CBS 8224 / DSM 1558 / NBRC 9311 / NRRL Y-6157 / RJB 2259-6 / UBC 559-6) TaxID=578456 RepID=UPI0003F4916C|nr:uncharacterized protein TREMEDRAFT_58766 [Tremella mesenterica DSM 1558]EIW72595.1 hypothetical protein TREMEDRAFT_58766 [Tremella mesenterica DSM 1558]
MSESIDTFDFTEIYEARGLTSSNAKSRLTTQFPETSSYSPSHLNNEADSESENDIKDMKQDDNVSDNALYNNDKNIDDDDDDTSAGSGSYMNQSDQDNEPEVGHEEMEDFEDPEELERALDTPSSFISETSFEREDDSSHESAVTGVYRRSDYDSYKYNSNDFNSSSRPPPLDNLIHHHLDSLREKFGNYFEYTKLAPDRDYRESRQAYLITCRRSGDSVITNKSAEVVYLSSEEKDSEGEEENRRWYESS